MSGRRDDGPEPTPTGSADGTRGTAASPTRARGGSVVARPPVNAVSLVFGLVFCGLALSYLLVEVGLLGASDLTWFLPILLAGAGSAGLVASLRRGRVGPPGPTVTARATHADGSDGAH